MKRLIMMILVSCLFEPALVSADSIIILDQTPPDSSTKVRASTQKSRSYSQGNMPATGEAELLDLFSSAKPTPRDDALSRDQARARDYVPGAAPTTTDLIVLPDANTENNPRPSNQQLLNNNRSRAQGYITDNARVNVQRKCVPDSTLVIGIEGANEAKNIILLNKGSQTADDRCKLKTK